MKHWFWLIILLLAAGCESKQAQTAAPAGDLVPLKTQLTGVTYAGGDGTSVENAVIIKTKDSLLGVRAEFRWVGDNHPNWQLKLQSVLKGGGKVYDKMYFRTPDGKLAILYFDVTDFYRK